MTTNSVASAKRPRLLMLGCGGTIGMVLGEDGALRPAQTIDEIVRHVPGVMERADVELEQLMNKDSTDICPEDWTRIAYELKERIDGFDGVIITHGTDTMAFTASALSFVFGRNLRVPIVITGSQQPATSFPTDAVFNVQSAVMAVTEAIRLGIAEVMIAFNDLVLRGNRTIKRHETQFAAFESPAFPPLARITAAGVELSPFALRRQEGDDETYWPHFHPNIVALELTPGSSVSTLISLVNDGQCRGILLKSLGAGNVPTTWLPTVSRIIKHYQIPVLVSTQFVGGRTNMEMYELGKRALDAGAIPTGNMTTPAAIVKLMWLLANGRSTVEELREGMATNFVGEIDLGE